jgi:hypothetical protein
VVKAWTGRLRDNVLGPSLISVQSCAVMEDQAVEERRHDERPSRGEKKRHPLLSGSAALLTSCRGAEAILQGLIAEGGDEMRYWSSGE